MMRVALLYGGRSPEHSVSCMSARGVLSHLDPARYDVQPIAIDPEGRWWAQDPAALSAGQGPLPVRREGAALSLHPDPGGAFLPGLGEAQPEVIFPIVHGPLCEDGTLQGLLELSELPYVGAGVLGSAICMDKAVSKQLAAAAGIACATHVTITRRDLEADREAVLEGAASSPGLPAFVKPANMGSSVGISRADDAATLERAVDHALQFDDVVLVEEAIDAREIELAVLSAVGGGAPRVSVPGEITPLDAFYDFDRKYVDTNGARLEVPADLTESERGAAEAMAREVFLTLRCEGMARIDLFLDRKRGTWLFNEANTLPGFTPISMYPRMWEASGLPYGRLLDHLIEHAIARRKARDRLRRSR